VYVFSHFWLSIKLMIAGLQYSRIPFSQCPFLFLFFFFLVLCCSFFQDWLDIDFGIQEGVDFIAISFVKSAEVINHLKSYIAARARDG
jgi:hypothetical protein